MLVVGLTGGIGCGKTLVSNLFHEKFAVPIIDADLIAKELTETRAVMDEISTQLGADFIDNNNQLSRKKLRQAIFSNPDTRDKLENILHPLVYAKIEDELNELDAPYCIVAIPLLLETQRTGFLDRILVVDCSIENQISRVMERDQCSEAHVKKIIATQISRESRLQLADDIVENNKDIDSVKERVKDLHKKYNDLHKNHI